MTDLIGHNIQIDQIDRAFKAAKLAALTIISGPKGIGKQSVIQNWIETCLNKKTEQSNSIQPDFILLQPESGSIKISQIHELFKSISLKSYSNQSRFILISEAHSMNLNAQNALLKTLEELPEKHHVFLLTHNLGQLKATIRSRASIVYFNPLTADETLKVLKQQGIEKFPKHWLELGSPGLIMQWLCNDKYLKHALWRSFFSASATLAQIIDFSKIFKDCEEKDALYEWLLFNVSRQLQVAPDFRWMHFADRLAELQRLQVFHLNPSLSMQSLLTSAL